MQFKINLVKCFSFVALATMACACQTIPSQPYNTAANVNVKAIGMAPIGTPEEASVEILAPAGANFGLIGALVEAGRASNAAKELQDILSSANYDFSKDIRDSLVDSLLQVGFIVKPPVGERDAKKKFQFLTKCVAVSADACLDVYVNYIGYIAAGPKTDYVPTVYLTARLSRANDGVVLFQDQVQYNTRAGSKAIIVQPTNKYRFKDRSAMQAEPIRVAEGLKDAVHAVADELAKQFK